MRTADAYNKMTSQWVHVIPELYLHTNNVIIQKSEKHIVYYKINDHYEAPTTSTVYVLGWEKTGRQRVKAYFRKTK
jgi:hypothetical protein